jgi:hypothetical protein
LAFFDVPFLIVFVVAFRTPLASDAPLPTGVAAPEGLLLPSSK